MPRFQLRIRVLPHGEAPSDEEEGQRLRELVIRAVAAGGAPLVGVVVRSDRVDIVDLPRPGPDVLPVPMLLAGLSRSEVEGAGPPRAVGLMGVVDRREPDAPAPSPMALVFLEWPDCRWWYWRAAVDPVRGEVVEEGQLVTCAGDGDPLPPRLGRWWSLGRRRQLSVRLASEPPDEASGEASPPVVH